jgi:ATP-dependent helicase/nuclease subunit A
MAPASHRAGNPGSGREIETWGAEMSLNLTDTQKIAVQFTDKDILLSAGAGSGKTRVLVERFLYFVMSGRAKATEILTLTFTEKAANEMKERIMKRFQDLDMQQARRDLELAYISTIHAFAARLLKEHPIEAGVHPDFTVLEPEEADLLQQQALDEVIEKHCVRGSGVFELLRIYGEDAVREGIKKCLNAARIEGLSLKDFFRRQPLLDSPAQIEEKLRVLFLKAEGKEFYEEFKAQYAGRAWNWSTVEAFRGWMEHFSKRGGKKYKEEWREISGLCKQLTGAHLDRMALPWRAHFEGMALQFEALYDAKKFEEGVLDFDDLQMKALELLRADRPGNRKLLEHYRAKFKFTLVDEFQDVNALQVKLIECFKPEGGAGEGHLFMVGDYKQSIYGFRGTSPLHFLEREQKFQDGGAGLLVEMLENFRTELPVLHFINTLFEKIWEEDGISYAGLMAKAEEKIGRQPELWVVRKDAGETTEEARLREAAAIAKRMTELHQDEKIPYGDMAVLFEGMTHAGIYEHALKAAGVPYFAVSGRGFYNQAEVRDMISFLSAVENPLLDIPLAAALRSPFFHISNDALFWLARAAKKDNENRPLYDGLKKLEAIAEITAPEKEKLLAFRQFLEELAGIKDSLRLSELLERVLRHTSYELGVLADRQGIRRYANLKKLVHLAREEETREKVSLGDFIRLVRGFEMREIRESEAQVEAEASGRVVRLMTVHGAKGLEFPVCFVADLGNRSPGSESGPFLPESGEGYSLKIYNEETCALEKPLSYERIRQKIETRETEEWKRVFYVALTRAKSRLILSGVFEEKKEPKESFREMRTWMDWMMAVAQEMPLEVHEVKERAVLSSLAPLPVFAEEKQFQELLKTLKPAAPEVLFPQKEKRAALSKRAEEIYRRLESHDAPPGRVLDLPVSAYCAFAKKPQEYWRIYEMGYGDTSHEQERTADTEPDWDGDAADFGTQMHKIFELLDFKDPEPKLSDILYDVFHGEEAPRIEEARQLALAFMKSEPFRQLQSAKKIYRELRFVLNERHGRVDGVIDVLFQDAKGAWHILDYKTAVGDEKKVKEAAYDLQIGIYAAAVSQILGTPPQSGILVFLKNNWVGTLPVTPAFLKTQTERLRQMQQKMMAYRFEKIHGKTAPVRS